ncbi:MAG: pilus assembly protein PilM [Planctomycetota bacterium]
MPVILGLDIGSTSITGAVFSGNQKKFRLIDFFNEEIPPVHTGEYSEDDDYVPPLGVSELLARIIEEHKLKDVDVVTAVDAKDCIMREISVPFTGEEQIRKTVFFEAENHFTGFDLENTILNHIKIGEDGDSSSLIVSALNNEEIESHLDLLKEGLVDPVVVDLDTCALFNAYKASAVFDEEKTALVVDMGATSTKIVLAEGGELKKMRSCRLETGVSAAARRLLASSEKEEDAAEKETETERAESSAVDARLTELENSLDIFEDEETSPSGSVDELDLAPDADDEEASPQDVPAQEDEDAPPAGDYQGMFPGEAKEEFNYDDYLARIALEIQRSLAGVTQGSSIEVICLTGGMSSRQGACAFFREEFDTETIRLDFTGSFEVEPKCGSIEPINAQGAVAIGLGMGPFIEDSIGVDYRRGEFRYEHKFERLKTPLIAASLLFFLLFLQLTFWTFRDWKEENARLAGYKRLNRNIYHEFFGEPLKGADPVAAMNARKRTWKGRGTAAIPRFVDFADALRSFPEAMKDSEIYFVVKSMDFSFEIKQKGSGKKSVDYYVQPARVEIEADTSSNAQVKLPKEFGGPKSIFNCKASLTGSRAEGKSSIPLELTIKKQVLDKYIR